MVFLCVVDYVTPPVSVREVKESSCWTGAATACRAGGGSDNFRYRYWWQSNYGTATNARACRRQSFAVAGGTGKVLPCQLLTALNTGELWHCHSCLTGTAAFAFFASSPLLSVLPKLIMLSFFAAPVADIFVIICYCSAW